MFIAYYDESGDDGWPKTSTDTFILSVIYMHHQHWKENYQRMHQFRKELWRSHGFPFSLEFHTREFLLDKEPYRNLGFDGEKRHEILRLVCGIIANLNCQIISVCIDKKAIHSASYDVLDRAFTYSIQRIENDLQSGGSRFLIISNEGRVGKMRKTSRRIQRFNPIQSKFAPTSYRKEIELLIEDPLPKSSSESFFIQIADTVSYLVGLQMKLELGHGGLPNRLAALHDGRRCPELPGEPQAVAEPEGVGETSLRDRLLPKKEGRPEMSHPSKNSHHLRRMRVFSGSIEMIDLLPEDVKPSRFQQKAPTILRLPLTRRVRLRNGQGACAYRRAAAGRMQAESATAFQRQDAAATLIQPRRTE